MDTETAKKRLIDTMEKFIGLASVRLPDDVYDRLAEMREKETSSMQQALYGSYSENLRKAAELGKPCCQDTGLPHFYVKAAAGFPHLGIVAEALREAVRRATASVPLRPNAVDFFDEQNTGDNTGERMPWIMWDIVSCKHEVLCSHGGPCKHGGPDSPELEITLYLAGAGCSLPGRARVFKPSDGYEAIIPFVFETVTGLGVNACPPLLLGIGLGHSMETAALLSKKACLRLIGTRHPHPKGAELERLIMEGLNGLGMGAQGLRGNQAVMAAHIESSARHTATIACGVSVSCYTHRRGIIRFKSDLSFELPTYRGATL